jgi:glucose/mannose-6-phosphate isomerase
VSDRDPQNMLADVEAQSHQVGDALWRVESAGIGKVETPGGLLVCGMGGSAIGGDLAAGAIGAAARRPLQTVRGYEVPGWTGPETLVLCASYSGETEETLACFEAAGAAGAPRVALTTGGTLAERARSEGVPVIGVPAGMQPRAAVVYMFVAALEVAAVARVVESQRVPLERAAELLAGSETEAAGEAEGLAARLAGRVPVVYGSGSSAAVAMRWKTQLNENAEVPAFWGELPEVNHNEIVGWANAEAPFTLVLLEAPGHPRLAARFEATKEAAEEAGIPVERVRARGDDPVAHVLSLVHVGDLVSVHLAYALGRDPTPVAAIDRLKSRLSQA